MSFHVILYPQKAAGLQKRERKSSKYFQNRGFNLRKIEEEKKSGNKISANKILRELIPQEI